MKPEETIDFHIRWAWARISRMYNQEASKHGGTMSVGYVLLNIDREGTPSTKLGPKMGMEPRSLTRTLKSMEEAGLIIRRPDSFDGRMVRVFLTDKGSVLREESKRVVISFNEFIRNHIAPEKLETFFEVMTEMNALCESEEIFVNPPKSQAV
ncbi:MAG: MarR family transcriptional regulator [Flavobacteriales bacterium]|nr:MarR family transcriptional regulator [Flavobacteriales bacterium]